MPADRTSFFDDDSMVRRVHREQVMGFAGPRALLLMAAHPVAFEGFFLSTGSLGDPYARLRRTGDVLDAVAWGPAARAERLTARVRAMHARVTGTLTEAAGRFPAGTPYRADDPALLLWILACLVDSSVLVYDQYVASMDAEERERYWRDYKVIGRLFGLTDADLPATWGDFRDYVDGVVASGDLHVTPRARALGIDIVMRPPVPAHLRPLVELANFVTVGLLPPAVRRQYGFSWDPARALARRSGAEYLKRVVVPLLPQGVRYVPSARSADAA
jgi:uncharacterized protein (DUF2236 family)